MRNELKNSNKRLYNLYKNNSILKINVMIIAFFLFIFNNVFINHKITNHLDEFS